MVDYLIALLKALINSFILFFSRFPALEWVKEWFEQVFQQLGPVAGMVLFSAAALMGAVGVILFFWILRRHPGRGKRAQILAQVLPFDAPQTPDAPGKDGDLVG